MKIFVICVSSFLILLLLANCFPSVGLPSSYEEKKVGKFLQSSFSVRDFYGEGEGRERVTSVDGNTEALFWRLNLIRSAKREICYTTFDFRADRSGTDVISAFYDAAERGVKVKILIDGINGWLRLAGNRAIRALAAHPNAEVREYNPVGPLTLWKIQFRMHDKYLIIDDKAYLLGGRNTNDLFLGNFSEMQNVDRELLVYETGLSQNSSLVNLRRYFDAVWHLPVSRLSFRLKPPASAGEALRRNWQSLRTGHPEILQDADWNSITFPTNRITILSNPADVFHKQPVLWYQLIQLMRRGKKPIVETPYLICNRAMRRDLDSVSKEAGSLLIITNSMESGANLVGCADYAVQRPAIRRMNADVYELVGSRSSHTKTVLIDNRISVVGTFNFDLRSTYLDTELMLAVDSEPLTAQLRQAAGEKLSCCKITGKDRSVCYGPDCPKTRLPAGRRLLYGLFGLLHMPFRRLL